MTLLNFLKALTIFLYIVGVHKFVQYLIRPIQDTEYLLQAYTDIAGLQALKSEDFEEDFEKFVALYNHPDLLEKSIYYIFSALLLGVPFTLLFVILSIPC